MTIIVSAGAASAVAGCASSVPLVGVATGLGVSGLGQMFGTGTLSTVAGAVGGSASAGAILGSVYTGTVNGAIVSGVSAVGSTGALALSQTLLAGPLGWLVLGADQTSCTFDCWKPVLRELSLEPSNGKILRDVVSDPRIKDVMMNNKNNLMLEIILQNMWDEKFLIEFITLPSGQLAAHAVLMN